MTKILYQTYSGGNKLHDPQELIGYCKEDPFRVLKDFYRTHMIYKYKEIQNPFQPIHTALTQGLVINSGIPPKGCSINQRLAHLNIKRGVLDHPPLEEDIRGALEDKIRIELSEYNPFGDRFPNYLDSMDFYRHLRDMRRFSVAGEQMLMDYERLAKQLCEVGAVILRKAEPLTIGELRDVWETAKSKEHGKKGVSSMEAGIEGHP